MATAIRHFFPKEIYNAPNLFFDGWAKFGLASAALAMLVYAKLSKEEKEELTVRGVALAHRISDPENVTDADVREIFWKCEQSIINGTLAGPGFYGAYHAIHPSGLPWKDHLAQAALRGLNGTLRSTPLLGGMFVAAAGILPYVQNRLVEKEGYSREAAAEAAETRVFAAAIPIELFGEGFAVKVTAAQFMSRLAPVAALSLTIRMATGTLPLFQSLAPKEGDSEEAVKAKKIQLMALATIGTTLSQYPLNAAYQAMAKDGRFREFFNYLRTGNIKGVGSYKSALAQLARVGIQRGIFMSTWGHLNDLSNKRRESE